MLLFLLLILLIIVLLYVLYFFKFLNYFNYEYYINELLNNKLRLLLLLWSLIIFPGLIYYFIYFYINNKKKKLMIKNINDENINDENINDENINDENDIIKTKSFEKYKLLIFVLLFLLLLIIIVSIGYYHYKHKILMYVLIFLILLIITIPIVYYIIYNNKEQTIEDFDAKIIKNLEMGSIKKRVNILLEILNNQGITTGVYYLKKMKYDKRLELYKNIELKYIQKIIVKLYPYDRKDIEEILQILKSKDKQLLFVNLRKINIILDTEGDIIGNKIIELKKLQEDDSEESLKKQISILCWDKDIDILIEELKKRNRFFKIRQYLTSSNANKLYISTKCKKKILEAFND